MTNTNESPRPEAVLCEGYAPGDIAYVGNVFVKGDGVDFEFPELQGPFTNPTWGELLEVADRMNEAIGDHHHIFLEEACRVGRAHGAAVLVLYMGS